MRALGRAFDVGTCIVPIDLATGANTGHRLHLRNYGGVAVVACFNNGTAAQAPVIVFREHTAATSGTSRDLDVVTVYHKKEEAALDGDETWTRVTQTAGDITNADWDDANEVLVVAEVEATQLSDDCEWISVDIADPGTAQVGAVFYIMYDLRVQRAPANLANPNA